MILPDYIKELTARLEVNGFEAYAVGGCVRDSLLGLTPDDYDVTTSATPNEIKTTLSGFNIHDTGLKHGTVTVVADNHPVEVTTFRVDGEYRDKRRPESVQFTRSLADDLSRRDFTVNAMAYSERSGIIDLYGGQADLDKKLIRAVGNPRERFGEDGLRILRALRFAAVYGFSLDDETEAAARELSGFIKSLSGERVAQELNKLVCGGVSDIIGKFADVFAEFIPEIKVCEGFKQHSKYHDRDVLTHTLNAVDVAPKDKITRLTLLFHDLGKPRTFTLTGGVGHFKGHAAASGEIASRVMRALKYDNDTLCKVLLLVKYHDLPLKNDEKAVKRLLNRFGEEMFFRLIDVHIADNEAKAVEYRARSDEFKAAAKTARRLLNAEACFSLKRLAVNGDDLTALGYRGADVGLALKALLQAVISEKCENNKKSLLDYLANHKKM